MQPTGRSRRNLASFIEIVTRFGRRAGGYGHFPDVSTSERYAQSPAFELKVPGHEVRTKHILTVVTEYPLISYPSFS